MDRLRCDLRCVTQIMAVVVLIDAFCNIHDIDARARGQRTSEAQLLTDLGNEHPFFGSKDCFAWVGLGVKPDKIESPNHIIYMHHIYTYIYFYTYTSLCTWICYAARCFFDASYFLY